MHKGANLRVGTFRYPIRVARIDGTGAEALEPLVDTGATYTWIPRPVLDRLGIVPTTRRRLELADGTVIEREAGLAAIEINGERVYTVCIFGDADSTPLLGAVTLEEAGLAPDVVRQRLVPVVGLLMAAV